MVLKIHLFVFVLLTAFSSHSQSERSDVFGEPTANEFSLKFYEDEPNAPGVILYESGNYYAIPIIKRTSVRLVKEVHRKVKVFDAKKFNYATVEIPYYKGNKYYGEEIKDFKAVTHNDTIQNFVPYNSFYDTQKQGVGNVLTFTFPNVQDGSILEYSYTIVSPYFFDLDGWEFQHSLPTIYSKFKTDLPAHFRYNRILYGDKKLAVERASVRKNGFLLPSNSEHVDTELALYVMENIPSFTEESYMLSRKNYISRIVYEPLAFKAFYGYDQVYTRSWEDVDYRFKIRSDFGEQLTKKRYFRRRLPKDILDVKDDLERAKAVYSFIQENYTWNKRYFNFGIKVKDAFEEKLGSVSAINLSLVNALDAAKLDAKAVILSTRNNGLPTELYPVLSNFNYVVAVLMIDDKKILLDATDKQAPFGIIPFRALNVQGRVLDFKKGGYWMPIEPHEKNIGFINSQIAAQLDGSFKGKVNQTSYGYIALGKRNTIDANTLENYKRNQEKSTAGIEITNHEVDDILLIENPLKESYNVLLEPEKTAEKIIIYPFFHKTYISENPFKMQERSYPMDFGYPFTNTYLISIDLRDVYKIEQLPESRAIKLPNDDGECSVTYAVDQNKINIRFNFKLNKYTYPSDAYESLKTFFATMVTMLKEEPIILEKI
ncbi:MAG TPA: hypothetical protein VKX34_10260 [Aequorivita sp.]|nr:hypothetical protein [Aequorivita sp.]